MVLLSPNTNWARAAGPDAKEKKMCILAVSVYTQYIHAVEALLLVCPAYMLSHELCMCLLVGAYMDGHI